MPPRQCMAWYQPYCLMATAPARRAAGGWVGPHSPAMTTWTYSWNGTLSVRSTRVLRTRIEDGGLVVLRQPVHVAVALAPSVGGTNTARRTSATPPAPAVRRLFTRIPTVRTKVGRGQIQDRRDLLHLPRDFRRGASRLRVLGQGYFDRPVDDAQRVIAEAQDTRPSPRLGLQTWRIHLRLATGRRPGRVRDPVRIEPAGGRHLDRIAAR